MARSADLVRLFFLRERFRVYRITNPIDPLDSITGTVNPNGSPDDFAGIDFSAGEVVHEWEIYAPTLSEVYGYDVGHSFRGAKVYHRAYGVDDRGFGVGVETVRDLGDVNEFTTGSPFRITCGATVAGYHVIEAAELLGDPVPFDMSRNGTYTATVTSIDGSSVVHSSRLSIANGTGFAEARAELLSGYPGIGRGSSTASYRSETDVVGRAAWRVRFRPIYPDGSPVEGKTALVILGLIDGDAAADIDQFVHSRTTPIDEVFALPVERVRLFDEVYCGANASSISPPSTVSDIAIADSRTVAPVAWSRRNSVAVVWSKSAFGGGSISKLADLNGSVSLARIEPHRMTDARFIDESGTVARRVATLTLPAERTVAVLPWFRNDGVSVGDTLVGAANRSFYSYGGEDPQFNRLSLEPYRFADIDIDASAATTVSVSIVVSLGPLLSHTKTWDVVVGEGLQTVTIDLLDPTRLNAGNPKTLIENLDGPGLFVETAASAPSPGGGPRSDGVRAFGTIRIDIPSGVTVKIPRVAGVAQTRAELEQWRGDVGVAGNVDFAHGMRTSGSALAIATSLSGRGLTVSAPDWSAPAGWLTSTFDGAAAIVDAGGNRLAPGDVLAGVDLRATAISQAFAGYWGMGGASMLSRDGANATFEYLWSNRVTLQTVPAVPGAALRVTGLRGDPRAISSNVDGLTTYDERDWYQPAAANEPVNPAISFREWWSVRSFSPDHAAPRQIAPLYPVGSVRGAWVWVGMAAVGSGERPARDANVAARHFRASVRGGRLLTAFKDNAPGSAWVETVTDIPARTVAVRVDRNSSLQYAMIAVESNETVRIYRSALDGSALELVGDVLSGVFPAIVILPDRRRIVYAVKGSNVVGAVFSGTNVEARSEFVAISGVERRGISAEVQSDGRGSHRVSIVAVVSGELRRYSSVDGEAFTADAEPGSGAGDSAASVQFLDGRIATYTVRETRVEFEIRSRGGKLLRSGVSVENVDPGRGVAVALTARGFGRIVVGMTVTRGGAEVELESTDGEVFA
jgi:hypothetical protein